MIWAYALDDLKPEQIKQGVQNLVHFNKNGFPPSAAEFRDLCLQSFKWETQAHKPWQPEKRLEDLTSKEKNHEAAAKFFREMDV